MYAGVFIGAAAFARLPDSSSSQQNRIDTGRPIRASFFTVRAGEGHIQITKAVIEYLQKQENASRFHVIAHPVPTSDVASAPSLLPYVLINHFFSSLQRQIWGAYTTIGMHYPIVWGPLFDAAGKMPRSLMCESLRGYLGAALADELNRGAPDVIVCTHPILV